MRKFLFSPLLLFFFKVAGQAPAQSGLSMPPPRPEFIVAVQIGTDTLKDGKVKVRLTDQTIDEMKKAKASPDYTVMLTSRGNCGQVNVVEETSKYFIVKELKNSGDLSGAFDYVVYVKQSRPMMLIHPQRPPMPPQQPAHK